MNGVKKIAGQALRAWQKMVKNMQFGLHGLKFCVLLDFRSGISDFDNAECV